MAITLISQAHPIQPVFNVAQFTFSSTNSAKLGFRYLVDIYSGNSTTIISRQKIVPQIDGTGKVDISRILANYLSYDFTPFVNTIEPTEHSFFNYSVKFGEEYSTPAWNFIQTRPLTASGTSLVYTILSATTVPPYVVNDQILINLVNTSNPLYGLHKVIGVTGNSIGVNVIYTGGTFTTLSGATIYADGRKSAFTGLTNVNNLVAFNGVYSFADYINYSTNIVNVGSTPNTIRTMLTDLPFDGFYMGQVQQIGLNVMITLTSTYELYAVSNDGQSAATQSVSASGLREVVQFPFTFDDTNFNLTNVKWVDLYITRNNFGVHEQATAKYRVYLDKRCTINDYEMAFVDRKGSILSYRFQLRDKDTGTIQRTQYKKQVPYPYESTDAGTTNIWVGVEKELELNTNWMSEEMSVLFEELLTSPNTWIKTGQFEPYYACTIVDSAFETEHQKNKRLIRKTVKIRMANNDAVNI